MKLFEATDNAAAVGCYHDNNIDIKHLATSILMKDKVSIAKDALNLICSRLGGDHAATRSELEKLALLAGPGGHLNLKTVSEALGDSAILAIDDIASAVADGQVLALSSALGKAWLEDANCVMIIRGCQNYFSQLRVLSHATNTGQSTQSAVRSLRPPVHFKLQDTLIRHTKRWQPRHCLNVINRLQDIEIKLKSKTINDRTLTAQALLGLCLRAK